MAIQLLTSKTAVGILGNGAIVSGFTGLGIGWLPTLGQQAVYPTLGPGMTNTLGFAIYYSDADPMHDRLITLASVPTTYGNFPGFAYGVLVWDMESLQLHCESINAVIPDDADVPAPFFPPFVEDTPPPCFGRATYLIGASLGAVALSSIGDIYPGGWNRNLAIDRGTGNVYWHDSWKMDPGYLWMNTLQDCVPPLTARFVFPITSTHTVTKLAVLDHNSLHIFFTYGTINSYGRKVWIREAVYDTPGMLHTAARVGSQFLCGVTMDKVVWIFDVLQQVYWQVSALLWPETDVYDNFSQLAVKMCYDERRGRLIVHQPRTQVPGSNPAVYVGNKFNLYALVPVPHYITNPAAVDTIRTNKRTFWFSKVVGTHGELISNKRVIARINNPVLGRMLSAQGATDARAQANFGYGGPDEDTDVGSSSITAITDDGPGLPA